jgi:signal-transduction protein with cAMP-binding, CBS, and nucleotidyltransferase domain
VLEAVQAMVDANVGALLVTADDDVNDVHGIFTERDYLRRVAVQGLAERETPVRDVMTTSLVVITPETEIEEAMAMMTDRRIRHIPVVSDGTVVGMISIGDLVRLQSEQQSFQIRYLTEYISAR